MVGAHEVIEISDSDESVHNVSSFGTTKRQRVQHSTSSRALKRPRIHPSFPPGSIELSSSDESFTHNKGKGPASQNTLAPGGSRSITYIEISDDDDEYQYFQWVEKAIDPSSSSNGKGSLPLLRQGSNTSNNDRASSLKPSAPLLLPQTGPLVGSTPSSPPKSEPQSSRGSVISAYIGGTSLAFHASDLSTTGTTHSHGSVSLESSTMSQIEEGVEDLAIAGPRISAPSDGVTSLQQPDLNNSLTPSLSLTTQPNLSSTAPINRAETEKMTSGFGTFTDRIVQHGSIDSLDEDAPAPQLCPLSPPIQTLSPEESTGLTPKSPQAVGSPSSPPMLTLPGRFASLEPFDVLPLENPPDMPTGAESRTPIVDRSLHDHTLPNSSISLLSSSSIAFQGGKLPPTQQAPSPVVMPLINDRSASEVIANMDKLHLKVTTNLATLPPIDSGVHLQTSVTPDHVEAPAPATTLQLSSPKLDSAAADNDPYGGATIEMFNDEDYIHRGLNEPIMDEKGDVVMTDPSTSLVKLRNAPDRIISPYAAPLLDLEAPKIAEPRPSTKERRTARKSLNPAKRASQASTANPPRQASSLTLKKALPTTQTTHRGSLLTSITEPEINRIVKAESQRTYGSLKTSLTRSQWESQLFERISLAAYAQRFIPQDPHLNILNQTIEFQRSPKMKDVFEMMIKNCTLDEPNAPPIRVINNVDPEIQPCPPWEFLWTNNVIYGKDIPKPVMSNLKGCGCQGPCDPKSRTCLCVARNTARIPEEWVPDWDPGFMYKDGKLRVDDCPVFECNEECMCNESCPNRVVQQGRKVAINLEKTHGKGWGIFAAEKIPGGTFLGIYSGELLTDAECEKRGHMYGDIGRTYLFDLDSWHLKPKPDDEHWTSLYSMDAFHVGNHTRFLNHSCKPNCIIVSVHIHDPNEDIPMLVLFTTPEHEVQAGEELCFDYAGGVEDIGGDGKTKDTAVYASCQCGAEKCRGWMFS